ncbi:AAA family ATPase [Solemya pervernicosa gill symbiont]|uniref:AAA family ATPase n=2 Tax=Gammaproteobacteria incertae sedis TaxID=118884 RepID=A0A1T2L3M6_9GAMM|nr:AAA family ATPase [Candidatus Reidiella endopervernicosa]OOZ39610.1 AAA family ATPase [Solemya pervernicosa gill symbiont]QKQ25460.1 AAA family ATPase [Candidatus Reidiella endopervernicosa]
MYLEHFALSEMPFTITPNTGFFFEYGDYRAAHNMLLLALRSGEGFLKVVAEVGMGKTLLCRALLNDLGDDYVTAYIPNPQLTAPGLRMALADELGLEFSRNIGQHRLLKLINEYLVEQHAAGKRVVLVIDEAQALPDEGLEALRLLTNLETESSKLLQVVLFGQPELDERISHPSLRQLKQRITFSHRLKPLDYPSLVAYLRYRLHVAGYRGTELFTPGAMKRLYRSSRGIPRVINILSHKALMVAFGKGDEKVRSGYMKAAIQDSTDVLSSTFSRSPILAYWLASLLTFSAVVIGVVIWSRLS